MNHIVLICSLCVLNANAEEFCDRADPSRWLLWRCGPLPFPTTMRPMVPETLAAGPAIEFGKFGKELCIVLPDGLGDDYASKALRSFAALLVHDKGRNTSTATACELGPGQRAKQLLLLGTLETNPVAREVLGDAAANFMKGIPAGGYRIGFRTSPFAKNRHVILALGADTDGAWAAAGVMAFSVRPEKDRLGTVKRQWQGQTAHPRDVTAKGWSSCYSLPREMSLRPDHTLAFQPAAELEKLRGQPRDLLSTAALGNTIASKAELPGECELRLTLKPAPGSLTGWRIGPEEQGLTLHYDAARQQLRVSVDATIAHHAYDGPFTAPCAPAADGTVTLRLFLDRSMVELYTPEGNVISTWAFFKDPAHNLLTALSPPNESALVSATLWPMSALHWSKANP